MATFPAKGARKAASTQRNVRLIFDQLRALGTAMREAGDNQTGIAAIRLLALSGLRRNEALGLRPDWLMDAGGVDLPDTKTGAQ